MRKTILHILPYVVLIFLIGILYETYNTESAHKKTVDALLSENEVYKLKNGNLVTSAKTIALNNVQLKNELRKVKSDLEMSKKFVKVETLTKIVTKTKIDTIRVAYKKKVDFDFEKVGVIENADYSLKYVSNQNGIKLSNFVIPDSLTIITGTKRKWLFGKTTSTIDVKHTNKLIFDENVIHINKEEKKKFYDTTLFKIGIGVLIGTTIK